MNEAFIGLLFLGALVAFVGLQIARRFGRLPQSLRIGNWVSGIIALFTGGYLWLFLNSLTIVTVISKCPEYAGVISAGPRHGRLIGVGQTDYFAFLNPWEGGISIEGKARKLGTYGYVTTFGIERLDFRLDATCKLHASQRTLA